jgi:putative pyruvate formate lyase activating enzyme
LFLKEKEMLVAMRSYQALHKSGELKKRAEKANALLPKCTLCPRDCSADRTQGSSGACRSSDALKISSILPHFGEEPPFTGLKGAGAVFFSDCNLKCVYCQNYEISWEGLGNYFTPEKLAEAMIHLQEQGCHNIDLVSPTHVVPQWLKALDIAAGRGLSIPLIYNSGGYDSLPILKLLEGVVDIYMPDMKYWDEQTAKRLSGIFRYPQFNQAAVKEMFRQVGSLQIDENGIAQKGLMIRHLILPNHLQESFHILKFVRDQLSREVPISLMSQYHPCFNATRIELLNRPISKEEYETVLEWFEELGLTAGFQQDLSSVDCGLPSFRQRAGSPFIWQES